MTTQGTIPAPTPRRGARLLALWFGAYAVLAAGLAAGGGFAALGANAFAAVVTAATLGLVLAYFLSPPVRALAEHLGPYGLAAFHVWRVLAALVFLYYGAQGWLPAIFVNLAGWGDMLAGVLAAVVLVLPRRARTVAAFHVVGFADFVVAVLTGLVLNAIDPAAMSNIALLPVALIPLIGVPLSGATHVAALHMLWSRRA